MLDIQFKNTTLTTSQRSIDHQQKEHVNNALAAKAKDSIDLVKETFLSKLTNTQEQLTEVTTERDNVEEEVQRLTKVCTQQKAELHELKVFKEE